MTCPLSGLFGNLFVPFLAGVPKLFRTLKNLGLRQFLQGALKLGDLRHLSPPARRLNSIRLYPDCPDTTASQNPRYRRGMDIEKPRQVGAGFRSG
jgi:hypothetical protein